MLEQAKKEVGFNTDGCKLLIESFTSDDILIFTITKYSLQEIKNNKSVDVVCIATSDKGYTDTVKELRRQGKKVVGIGEKKAPKELRDACSEFFEIK